MKFRWSSWKLIESNTDVMPTPLVELIAFILLTALPVPRTVWKGLLSDTEVRTGCTLGAVTLPVTLRFPAMSKFVAIALVASLNVSLGVPSTEIATW